MPKFLSDAELPKNPDGALEAATKQYVDAGDAHNHDAAYVNEGDHTKAAHDALAIDADTVDGQHATAFATSGHGHSIALGDLSNVTATGEGAGGGFDADTVDGQHASAFAAASHGTHVTYGSTIVASDYDLGNYAGTSSAVARADHRHALTDVARIDHTHAYVSKSGDTMTGELVVSHGAAVAQITLGRTAGYPSIKSTDTWLILDSAGVSVSLNHYVADDVTIVNGGGSVCVGAVGPVAGYKLDVRGALRVAAGPIHFTGGSSDRARVPGFAALEDGTHTYYYAGNQTGTLMRILGGSLARTDSLTGDGTSWASFRGSAFEVASSRRYKRDIAPIDPADSVRTLRALRPITHRHAHIEPGAPGDREVRGFVAEQLPPELTVPTAVNSDELEEWETGEDSPAWSIPEVVTVLASAMQDVLDRVEALETRSPAPGGR